MSAPTVIGIKPAAGVLGAGQCFMKMLPGLRRAFDLCMVYDPNPGAPGLTSLGENELRRIIVGSEEEFRARLAHLACVFVLSPPNEHARQISFGLRGGKAVFVEKPLVSDPADLPAVDEALRTTNGRLYCSDFYLDVRGAALVAAFGRRLRHSTWINEFLRYSPDQLPVENLRAQLGTITSIRGRLMEGIGIAGDIESRPWLASTRGGGVILDLAYHLVTLYMALFSEPLYPVAVTRGVHPRNRRGLLYIPCSGSPNHAETYTLIRCRSLAGCEVEFEAAKRWTTDERFLEIRGSGGYAVVDFDGSIGPKNAAHFYLAGNSAEASLQEPYWDLVAMGFRAFLDSHEARTHGYEEAMRALRFLDVAVT